MSPELLEFIVVVVAALIIFDAVYELCRLWLNHTTEAARRRRLEQHGRKRW